MISGSNFAVSVLLARWLSAETYGSYALAFAIFLLVSQFQQALLLEPMSVFGSSIHRGKLRSYLGRLLWLHGGTSALISAILAAGAWGVVLTHGSKPLAAALLGVSLASPCILLFWLLRRSFYIELQPGAATQGAVLYCGLVLVMLLAANFWHVLSPFIAFLLMGMAALITSGVFLIRLKPDLSLTRNELSMRETSRQHWIYGRWALASAVAMWIPTNIYYVLLGTSGSMAHAGELRALMNLALPVGQTATALSLLFIPYASRMRAEQGPEVLRKISFNITLLFGLGAVMYWIALVMFRGSVLHLFYGGHYSQISAFVPVVAVSSIFQTCISGPGIGLRANEMPICIFYAYLVSSLITVGVGVIATRMLGVQGAVGTMLLANLSAFLVAQFMLRRQLRRAPAVLAEAA
jgi:O-antigen/teichoic acid export membrane protein